MQIFYVILLFVVLAYAVHVFIESSSKIAHKLKISEFAVSFVLVALGTSLPELVVGVISSIKGNSILSYGNVIGSNIALLTVIIGSAAVIGKGIPTKHVHFSKDIYNAIIVSILAMALAFDGQITRIEGCIMLTGYVLYSALYIKRTVGFGKLVEKFEKVHVLKEFIMFVVSLGVILFVSNLIVKSAEIISVRLGVAIGFVGLSITAIGTSLPEIAYSISSQIHKKSDEIIGNLIGSLVVNSTLVLGATAVIHPVNISKSNILNTPSVFTIIFATLLFIHFSKSKDRLDKTEGLILILVYVCFMVVEYFAQ